MLHQKKLSKKQRLINTIDAATGIISSDVDIDKAKTEVVLKETSGKKDFTDSYPPGYFDLFGSIDDPSYPSEPEELSWDLENKKTFF